MQLAVRKSVIKSILLLLFIVFVGFACTSGWKSVISRWNDKSTWNSPFLKTTQEGGAAIATAVTDGSLVITIPSCSLYDATIDSGKKVTINCSLYPARYFTVLYWLKESAESKPDFEVTIPEQARVTINGNVVPITDIPAQASVAHPIRLTLYVKQGEKNFPLYQEIKHYLVTQNGKTETKKEQLLQVDITDTTVVSKKQYVSNLFTKEITEVIKTDTDKNTIEKLLSVFRKDASNTDASPHFTEGLLYGLYLLGENDSALVDQILATFEKQLVPFHAPNTTENEEAERLPTKNSELYSAPHTKFPLCPIQAVVQKQWNSPSIRLFLAYQKYQPRVTAKATLPQQNIYDKEGNLLLYDNMVELDEFCRKVILDKQVSDIDALQTWYQRYVNQYFVYTSGTGEGVTVIEGNDLQRGVVMRGLANDPNLAKQNIALTSVKRSLFDGILWVYLYGK